MCHECASTADSLAGSRAGTQLRRLSCRDAGEVLPRSDARADRGLNRISPQGMTSRYSPGGSVNRKLPSGADIVAAISLPPDSTLTGSSPIGRTPEDPGGGGGPPAIRTVPTRTPLAPLGRTASRTRTKIPPAPRSGLPAGSLRPPSPSSRASGRESSHSGDRPTVESAHPARQVRGSQTTASPPHYERRAQSWKARLLPDRAPAMSL